MRNELATTSKIAARLSVFEEGTTIVKSTANGMIRAVAHPVSLRYANKELYFMKAWRDNKSVIDWRITADGYYACNKVAQIHIHTPQAVAGPDGKQYPNPYAVHDQSGNIVGFWIRKMVIGRGPLGNMVAIDQNIYFSPQQMLASNLYRKWRPFHKKAKDGGGWTEQKKWGKLIPMHIMPDAVRKDTGQLIVPYVEGLGLVVDINHPEVLDILAGHGEVVRFADRRAATICERNCLRKHPGIAKVAVHPQNDIATIPILGWVDEDRDLNQVNELAIAIEGGHLLKAKEIMGEEIEAKTVEASIADAEDIAGTEDSDESRMDMGEQKDEVEEETAPLPQKTTSELRKELRGHMTILAKDDQEKYDAFKAEHKIGQRDMGDVSTEELEKMLDDVQQRRHGL